MKENQTTQDGRDLGEGEKDNSGSPLFLRRHLQNTVLVGRTDLVTSQILRRVNGHRLPDVGSDICIIHTPQQRSHERFTVTVTVIPYHSRYLGAFIPFTSTYGGCSRNKESPKNLCGRRISSVTQSSI